MIKLQIDSISQADERTDNGLGLSVTRHGHREINVAGIPRLCTKTQRQATDDGMGRFCVGQVRDHAAEDREESGVHVMLERRGDRSTVPGITSRSCGSPPK